MASDVDICNAALSHLGDEATVTSIDPPEGSVQAQHCARFYPMARDALLEQHAWGFATRRVQLAAVPNTWSEWNYAYVQPADAITLLDVLPPGATDDYSEGIPASSYPSPVMVPTDYVPQPYTCEVDADGRAVILTDQQGAVLRYTGAVTNTDLFSPLFEMTLSWQLASMLAGPMLRGDAGADAAKRCAAMVEMYLGKAKLSDATQRNIKPKQTVSWIANR